MRLRIGHLLIGCSLFFCHVLPLLSGYFSYLHNNSIERVTYTTIDDDDAEERRESFIVSIEEQVFLPVPPKHSSSLQ